MQIQMTIISEIKSKRPARAQSINNWRLHGGRPIKSWWNNGSSWRLATKSRAQSASSHWLYGQRPIKSPRFLTFLYQFFDYQLGHFDFPSIEKYLKDNVLQHSVETNPNLFLNQVGNCSLICSQNAGRYQKWSNDNLCWHLLWCYPQLIKVIYNRGTEILGHDFLHLVL